jgi:hypothetical protein
MKTILLIAILAGFLTTGGYAQDIDCRQVHVAGTCPGDNVRPAILLVPSNEQVTCAAYTKGTSFISACPDSTDISGNVQFTVDGNYPMACTSRQRLDGTVVVTCRPKCLLMEDPVTGRQWYKCPND